MLSTRQDLTQGLIDNGDLEDGEVAHKPRLIRCWTVLIIGSLGAMSTLLAFAKSPGTKPGDLAGHRFTRPKDLVQCESMFNMY